MIICLLIVAMFFIGVVVGWRSRGQWDRLLQDFVSIYGD